MDTSQPAFVTGLSEPLLFTYTLTPLFAVQIPPQTLHTNSIYSTTSSMLDTTAYLTPSIKLIFFSLQTLLAGFRDCELFLLLGVYSMIG